MYNIIMRTRARIRIYMRMRMYAHAIGGRNKKIEFQNKLKYCHMHYVHTICCNCDINIINRADVDREIKVNAYVCTAAAGLQY
jgi:hypothetical protein